MNSKEINQLTKVDGIRRKLLLWTPPLISVVVLPVHAQTSVCVIEPTIEAIPAKCSGVDPQGQATLTIVSPDAGVPLNIISISNDAVEPNMIGGATSGTSTSASGLDITWNGPSTDSTTCLPEVNVNFVVTYTCNNDPVNQEFEFNLLDELAKVVP